MKKPLTIIYILVAIALVLVTSVAVLKPTSFRPQAGNAGSLTLAMSPNKLNLRLNETAKVEILVDSGGKEIEGFFVRLAYDSTKFKVSNGKVNPAYEEVMNWATSPGHIGFSGILPPSPATGISSGVLASFEIQGLAQTDGSSVTFAITNSRFQLSNGSDQFTVTSAPMATFCVEGTAASCPALACAAGKPTIIYPIRGKKTLDSKFEIAIKSTLGCFPQEYQITLRNSAGTQLCASSWLTGLKKYDPNNKEDNGIKHHYASEFGCPDMTLGDYQAEVVTRYQGRISEPDSASFTYANDSFGGSMPANFIGAFGNTDVTIPSGYAGFSRWGYGRTDTYVTSGVPTGSGNSYFFTWRNCFAANWVPPVYRDFKECLGYNYRKMREMAINFGGIGTLSIDDVKFLLDYSWLHVNLNDLRQIAAGPNGKLGITWYGEDGCPGNASQVSWVFVYTKDKANFGTHLQTAKNCFTNAKIVAGIYPRSMDGMVGYGDFGFSDEEEISQTCYQTTIALQWLTKGDVIGIEIYDNAPTKPGFEELDKTCAQIATEILAGGDPEECHP